MTSRPLSWGAALLAGMLGTSLSPAVAAECRVGYDVGSSGLRVGSLGADGTAKISVDYLSDVWPDNKIDVTVDATVDALLQLPKKAGLPDGCEGVAGGYSAWRYALEKGGAAQLTATLGDIHRRSKVALLVIPQDVEGGYAFFAAKRLLGERLHTPMILDIGGGSMQLATINRGWGAALGQKAWLKQFCATIKGSSNPTCTTNPVGSAALPRVREVLAPEFAAAKALAAGQTVTAVSAPVVKGVRPILQLLSEKKLIAGAVDANSFSRAALASGIGYLAEKDDAGVLAALENCREGTAQQVCAARYVNSIVTDMLLVHTLMDVLNLDQMEVLEADVTNVPGILADARAARWAGQYDCYLARLRSLGIDAFKSDPASCPR